MKRSHLRLVGSGGKSPQEPKPRPRARKSVMREIEDLSELHNTLRGWYTGQLLGKEAQDRVRDRMNELVSDLLSRRPRALYEAADLAKVVAVNRDLPEAADAIRELAIFYNNAVAGMERRKKPEEQ